jgi:hypothetical protein
MTPHPPIRNQPANPNTVSWLSLWRVLAIAIGIWYYTTKAASEAQAAINQQSTYGLITSCNTSTRHERLCTDTFSVGDARYEGRSSAGSDVEYGQTQVVYFDAQNPAASALEDFSALSRRHRNLAYLLTLVVAAALSFVFYSNSRPRDNSIDYAS